MHYAKPRGFGAGTDVILVLVDDNQAKLPVHSAFLVAQSQVLCDMLYIHIHIWRLYIHIHIWRQQQGHS